LQYVIFLTKGEKMDSTQRKALIDIVHSKFKRTVTLGKSPLHFTEQDYFFTEVGKPLSLDEIKESFESSLSDEDIEFYESRKEDDRLYKVRLLLYSAWHSPTYNKYGKRQCRMGAYRSATDLFRLYKYYFPKEEIDIVDIMRALYNLDLLGCIGGQFCSTVRRQVFWDVMNNDDYGIIDDDYCNELAVPFFQWKFLYI